MIPFLEHHLSYKKPDKLQKEDENRIRVLEEKMKKKRKGVELEAQTIKQSQAIWLWPP